MKDQVSNTPVRTDKDVQQAIEELRRQSRALVQKVTELETKVAALTPPST